MPALPDSYLNRIICGDAIAVIKQLPPGSVDLIVTDPPYGDNTGYGTQQRASPAMNIRSSPCKP